MLNSAKQPSFRTKRRIKTSTLDISRLCCSQACFTSFTAYKNGTQNWSGAPNQTDGAITWSHDRRSMSSHGVSLDVRPLENLSNTLDASCSGREHRVSQMQPCKTPTLIVLNPCLICANLTLNYFFGSNDFRQYHLWAQNLMFFINPTFLLGGFWRFCSSPPWPNSRPDLREFGCRRQRRRFRGGKSPVMGTFRSLGMDVRNLGNWRLLPWNN